MMTWIYLVLAIVVAQMISVLIALGLMMNRRFLKWYYKKFNKITDEIIYEIDEEDET